MATATQTRSKSNKSNGATSADVETSLKQVRADIASLSETLSSYGKGKLGDAQKSASAKSDDVIRASEETLHELRNQVDDLARQLEGRVRAKPIQSLAIAAGVGALISLLVRR
jgi:ElaB/YqjD/DUF883 family membrane-anchored ribosome-binding protein